MVSGSVAGVARVAEAQPGPAPETPAPETPTPNAPVPETPTPAPVDPSAPTILVRGRVIDAFGKPVRNARISIEGSDVTAKSERDGFFKLRAPVGATLIVESNRFEPSLAIITGDVVDDIVMLSSSQLTETIQVAGEAPAAVPGAAKLDREELQRIPGTGGDIVRALTIMPGVVNLQVPIGFSGVVIRGSSPQDSKVFVDNFEIPVLFHNIGFRAVTPAETIESLDFIPGGFDVAYGRASSGIVKLTTRPGSDDRTSQAEVSFVDGGVVAQGPAGDDTRYMLAARRSTIDYVLPALIPESVDLSLTTVPRYWDAQFRIDRKLSNRWSLSLSNVSTDDTFELVGSKDEDAVEKRFFNRTRFARLTGAARYSNGPWSADLAVSGLAQQFVFEIGAFQFIRSDKYELTPRFEITRTATEAVGLKNIILRAGGEAAVGRYGVEIALPIEPREGDPNMGFDPEDTSTSFTGNVWTPNFAAWTAVSADLDPKIRATVGLRAEHFGRPNQSLLQPRGELSWKLSKEWTARFSAGLFSRPPEFQSELLAENVDAERSRQTIAGIQWEPREGIRAQGSVYYTDRYQLITSGQMPGELANRGRGRTYGGELLATYRGGPWFAWLSYSLSRSERVDNPGEDLRLFSFDQPHSMNAAVSWKKGKWQLGGRFQVYSGLPYTQPIGSVFDSDRNLYIPLYGEVNGERAELHHQLDLRIDRTWQAGPVALTGFLDVQNVYANDSVVTYFYSYDYLEKSAFRSIPIIPSIGLRGVL